MGKKARSAGKRSETGILQTFVLAAGDHKSITIEIPGSITKTGEPIKQTFEYHNNSGVPLAWDIREIRITQNAEGKPEIHIDLDVRQPTQRENGELHEAAARLPQYALA